jgi:hypothetical protein
VFVKKQDMAEPWNLVSSLGVGAHDIVQLYGRRFTCEEQYRDEKDDRFGMGSRETRVSTTARRDRCVLIDALVTVLLTLLGAAAEMVGYDRCVRANTLRTFVPASARYVRITLELSPGSVMPSLYEVGIHPSATDERRAEAR